MFARWRQHFSQGQVISPSSGSQSTSLNHSGAMQASMISFYCSGLICHNLNFLSLRHVCLLSYGPRVLCPGSQERYWKVFDSSITFCHFILISGISHICQFFGITTLSSRPVQGALKSARTCDKIAQNGQNGPFSVFYAKRGTGLKKVHHKR